MFLSSAACVYMCCSVAWVHDPVHAFLTVLPTGEKQSVSLNMFFHFGPGSGRYLLPNLSVKCHDWIDFLIWVDVFNLRVLALFFSITPSVEMEKYIKEPALKKSDGIQYQDITSGS